MENFFELDHQNFNFDLAHVTLAWRGYYAETCNNSYIQIQLSPIICDSDCILNSTSISVNESTMVRLPLYTSIGDEMKFKLSVQECSSSTSDQEPINVTFAPDCKFFFNRF